MADIADKWVLAPEILTLSANEVHIWHAHLPTGKALKHRYAELLCANERQRMQRFHFEKHQHRFALAHGLLRLILSRYLTVTPQDIRYTTNEYGKPDITAEQNQEHLQFNLSHSENEAVVAITKRIPIGVDIEWIKPRALLELAKRFFAADEYTALTHLPEHEQTNAFFHIWTQKEAVIKALGLGLHYPLQKFSVSAQPPARLLNLEDEKNPNWTLQSLNINKQFAAAYATHQEIHRQRLWSYVI